MRVEVCTCVMKTIMIDRCIWGSPKTLKQRAHTFLTETSEFYLLLSQRQSSDALLIYFVADMVSSCLLDADTCNLMLAQRQRRTHLSQSSFRDV